MKNAAKCDKQCDLHNSVSHKFFERTLRPPAFWRACLFERHFNPQALPGVGGLRTQPPKASGGGAPKPTAVVTSRSGSGSLSCRKTPISSMVDLESGRNTR